MGGCQGLVLKLLEVGYLRLRKPLVKVITVIEFGVSSFTLAVCGLRIADISCSKQSVEKTIGDRV